MENFDVIAENVVGAIIKQACQGVEDRLGEHFSCYNLLNNCQAQVRSPKVQIPVKGLGVTLKSHRPPT